MPLDAGLSPQGIPIVPDAQQQHLLAASVLVAKRTCSCKSKQQYTWLTCLARPPVQAGCRPAQCAG